MKAEIGKWKLFQAVNWYCQPNKICTVENLQKKKKTTSKIDSFIHTLIEGPSTKKINSQGLSIAAITSNQTP